jgi:hypothetical protein
MVKKPIKPKRKYTRRAPTPTVLKSVINDVQNNANNNSLKGNNKDILVPDGGDEFTIKIQGLTIKISRS